MHIYRGIVFCSVELSWQTNICIVHTCIMPSTLKTRIQTSYIFSGFLNSVTVRNVYLLKCLLLSYDSLKIPERYLIAALFYQTVLDVVLGNAHRRDRVASTGQKPPGWVRVRNREPVPSLRCG
jgi:hypothetical protein